MPTSRRPITIPEAIAKLEAYCAYQERSEQEVLFKLKKTNLPPESYDAVLSHLIKENYLDEARFACTYARGKFNLKKWGHLRIRAELKSRGISSPFIEQAMNGIDPKLYLQTFETLAKKRWSQINEKDPHKKNRKLASYLLYRGWESDLVYGMIHSLKK